MKGKSSKKGLLLRFSLNIIVFMFFFSLALRTTVIKDINDILQRANIRLESVIHEFTSTNSTLNLVGRILFAGTILLLPNLAFIGSALFVLFFAMVSFKFGKTFAIIISKKADRLYFNKYNSKQLTYITISRFLC